MDKKILRHMHGLLDWPTTESRYGGHPSFSSISPRDDLPGCPRNLLHQNLNLNQEKQLLRKNLEQRLTEVLKGRRKKSRKLERKVLHRPKMVKPKLKRSTSLAQLLVSQPPEVPHPAPCQ
ncbi:high mobility group nucleosome-binding domain-containing protein 3 isoform X3 [Cavia porcellus]|uniref:high mobility group nucleosome-binding domain-containing protein 3 isoform X3 n=1 Tax=Cavia porcellus TaxID=10141 RepID=UPI002FE003D8